MSSILPGTVGLSFSVTEYNASTGFGSTLSSSIVHAAARSLSFGSGTGNGNADVVYSTRSSIASGVPLDIDLRAGASTLSRLDGGIVSFPLVVAVVIVNNSVTAGQTLAFGVGANPVTSWMTGTTPTFTIGAGGFLAFAAPIDGYATTAGTADIMRIASTTGTVVTDIFILGRQS